MQERYKCMGPHCGYCGKCGMLDRLVPEEVFSDYIEGKVKYVTMASQLQSAKNRNFIGQDFAN